MNHLKFRKAWELVVLMLFAVSANASTTILSFNLSEFLANPTTNRQVALQPMSSFPGNTVYIYSDTNGIAYLTNPVATLYNGYIAAPPAKTTFQLWVTSTNLGLVDAYSLLATGSASTYPAGQVAWAISTSDARYQLSGSASSNAFYPLSNPSNYATLTQVTNIASRANTNAYVPGTLMSASTNGGTITFNAAQQTNASFASTNYVNTATNNLLATITNIAAGQVGSANFQPSSANLSNYATLPTNSYPSQASFLSASNALAGMTNGFTGIVFSNPAAYQVSSANLTNFSRIGTNSFYANSNPSNFVMLIDLQAATNAMATTNYVNAATNNLLPTITNIASQFSATASNAIAANNGFGTNTTILNGVSLRATNLYGGQLVITNNTVGSTNNSGVNLSVNGNPVFQIGQNANVNGHFLIGNLSNMVGDGIFGDNPDNSNKDRGVGIIGGNWNHNTDLSGGNMFYQYIVGGVSNTIYAGNRGSNVMIIGGANVSLTTFGSTGSGSIDNSSVIFSRDSAITNVNQNGNVSGNNVIFSRNSTIYSGNNFSNNVIFSANNIVITNAKNSLGLGTGILISNDNVVAISGSTNGTINSTTNSQMLMAFTNGVAINTNSAGTNGLRVAGNVDSSVGFTVNGVPVASAANAQPANANLTNFSLLPTNSYIPATAASGFQPADSDLTNYALLPTNSFIPSVALVTLQPADADLTNYSLLPTNSFYATANPSNFITKAETTNLVVSATNGLASTNYVKSQFVPVSSGMASNLTVTGTGGYDLTLPDSTGTNFWRLQGNYQPGIGSGMVLSLSNANVSFPFDGQGGFAANGVNASTISATNFTSTQTATIKNIKSTSTFSFGNITNLQVTTNIVGVVGGGSAAGNGTFVWNATHGLYSNATTSATINFQNPTWFITTNGVNLYSSSSPNGPWAIVSGSSPVPTGDYGVYFKQEGIVYTGVINSTNLTYQITNAIAASSFGVSTKIATNSGTSWNQMSVNPTLTDGISTVSFDGSGGYIFYDNAATPTWYGDYWTMSFINNGSWDGSGYRAPIPQNLKFADSKQLRRKDFVDVPYTDYSPMHGGSGAALGDLPPDERDGQLVDDGPPIAFTSWKNPGGSTVTNWAGWTNIMNQITTNGLLAAITNAGGSFWMMDDNGSQFISTNRINGGEYLGGTYSNLTIDLTLYPQGSNWTSIVHSNGFKWMSTISARTMPGNKNPIYTNGVPIQGHTFLPEMSPETIQRDMTKFYDFNLDGVRVADPTYNAGYHIMIPAMVHESIMMPFYTDKRPFNARNDIAGGREARRPLTYFQLGNRIGYFPQRSMRAVNWLDYDTYADYTGYLTNADWTIDMMNRVEAVYDNNSAYIGKGHYHASAPFNSTLGEVALTNTQFGLTANAMLLSGVLFAFDKESQIGSVYPNLISAMTNKTWLRIEYDKLRERPYYVQRNGPTNVGVMYRRLTGGSYAIGIFNPTAVTTNVTVEMDSLGAITNEPYVFYSAWDSSSAGGSRGKAVASFTFTNLNAKCAALVIATPWMPYTNKTVLFSDNNFSAYGVIGTELGGNTLSSGLVFDVYPSLTNTMAAGNVVSHTPLLQTNISTQAGIVWTNHPSFGSAFYVNDGGSGYGGVDFSTNSTWLNTNNATIDLVFSMTSANLASFGFATNYPDRGFMLLANGNTPDFYFGPTSDVSASVTIADGQIHEITGTYNSRSNAILYVDGVAVASTSRIGFGALVDITNHLYLQGTGANVYRARIWNRDLGTNEVIALHSQTLSRFGSSNPFNQSGASTFSGPVTNNGVYYGNGAGLTNLPSGSLPAILTTNQVYASNVISGGVLPDGTIAATVTNNSSGSYGYIRDSGGTRWRTQDGQLWTNLIAANLVGTSPLSTLPSAVVTNNQASGFTNTSTFNQQGGAIFGGGVTNTSFSQMGVWQMRTNPQNDSLSWTNPTLGIMPLTIGTNAPGAFYLTNGFGGTNYSLATSTLTNTAPIVSLRPRWDNTNATSTNTTVAFTAIQINVDDHIVGFAQTHYILNLLVNGTSKFLVDRFGNVSSVSYMANSTANYAYNGAQFGRSSGNIGLQGGASAASGTMDSSFINTGVGQWTLGTNLIAIGVITATNGYASYKNNLATNTVIAVGSSPFNWTNTTGVNVFVDIDANGATTAVQRNGQNIFGTLASGDHEVYVKPNGYLTVTYSVATPIMGYTEQ